MCELLTPSQVAEFRVKSDSQVAEFRVKFQEAWLLYNTSEGQQAEVAKAKMEELNIAYEKVLRKAAEDAHIARIAEQESQRSATGSVSEFVVISKRVLSRVLPHKQHHLRLKSMEASQVAQGSR